MPTPPKVLKRRSERNRKQAVAQAVPVRPVQRNRVIEPQDRVEKVHPQNQPVRENRFPPGEGALPRFPVPDHVNLLRLPGFAFPRVKHALPETCLAVPRESAIKERYKVHRRERAQSTKLQFFDDRQAQLEVDERRARTDELITDRAPRERILASRDATAVALCALEVERACVVTPNVVGPAPIH